MSGAFLGRTGPCEPCTLSLHFPPSVNRMWRSVRGRNILSAEGRAYRAEGLTLMTTLTLTQRQGWPYRGRLAVTITVFPPDKRRRDLDNMPKAVLDLLTAGQVYVDDSQIDRLLIVRGPVVKGGRVRVEVGPLEGEQ